MARRPIIQDPREISREYKPNRSSSRPDGYIAGPMEKEVIGMDGRNDWFRANCRECGQKIITIRREKRQTYYSCPDCGAWHHQHKGFFDLDRFETKPLKNSEIDGQLYRVKLNYASNSSDRSEWHYGTEKTLKEVMNDSSWDVVEDMEPVQ